MRCRVLCSACLLLTGFGLVACGGSPGWNGSLEDLLLSQPDRFGTVMSDPARYRVQIIYTQVDRDAGNRPSFRTYRYRVDSAEYFYPASTVKLPTAMAALEKLRNLGVDRDATMQTGAAADFQTPVTADPTAPRGLPSVAHYVRKILVVSDNDAFNRLYEFAGQRYLNELLHRRGLGGTRIVHRLEIALTPDENRMTNPVRFLDGDSVIYEQQAVHEQAGYLGGDAELLGRAEIVDGVRLDRPKDFSEKNAFPLEEQHDLLVSLLFPDAVPDYRRFDLADDDYRFLYRWMSTLPAESGVPAYSDPAAYPDGYVKFLMFGGDAERIPDHIRVFNKVGDAYGFLTDAAYIVDFENGVEFILAATIYTNANATFNDDEYEYEEIGLPFLRELGRAIYEIELDRSRPYEPDLSRFRFQDRGILPDAPNQGGPG